ncbi:MAG: 3'(2'),5'-bisphosphate nucleotidase CysQ [Halothiobacillaceae bacterium]
MSTAELERLFTAARQIAIEAGEAILAVYHRDFAVQHKQDQSPLTEADLAANRIIVEGLQRLTPELPVLTEEGALPAWAERSGWSRYWLVDPLDGTREFVNRNDEFTVNIALVEEHQPILGIVYAPALSLMYGAIRQQGVWRWDEAGERQPIACRARPPEGPVRVAISRSHMSDQDCRLLERLGPHEVIRCGSALKSCLIAEGTADLYPRLGPTSEWDTAAAQCVLEEAGGYMTDTRMNRLACNRRESVLNPPFFAFAPPWTNWSRYLDAPADQNRQGDPAS